MSLSKNRLMFRLKKLNNNVVLRSLWLAAVAATCGLMLMGCGRRAPVVACTWQRHDVATNQARLSDVALPLKITPIAAGAGSHTVIYTVKSARASLVDFYVREMERLGWLVLGRTDTSESLLVFDKTSRVCVVSIRDGSITRNPLHGTLPRNGCYVRIDIINKNAVC